MNKLIIIIWGVSRSRQHSRHYITAEDKATLNIRHKAWHSKKCEKSWRAKSRWLGEERRQTFTGRHWRQGRVKPITGHIINRAFNQDMGNQKVNLTRGGTSRAIKWPSVRWVWLIRRRDRETSKWWHRWEQDGHRPWEGLNWANLLPSATHWSQWDCQEARMERWTEGL